MKNLSVILLIFLTACVQEKTEQHEKSKELQEPLTLKETKVVLEESNNIFLCPEIMPEYSGGRKSLQKFFFENLKYPQEAEKNKIEGKVFVSFYVLESGKIDSVKIVKSVGYGCDEEVIRVVRLMPDWIPGRMGGEPSKVKYTLPINFKID